MGSITLHRGNITTDDARITGAGRLAARFVIHAVGPIWHGGDHASPPGSPPRIAGATGRSAVHRLGGPSSTG